MPVPAQGLQELMQVKCAWHITQYTVPSSPFLGGDQGWPGQGSHSHGFQSGPGQSGGALGVTEIVCEREAVRPALE